MRNKCKRKKEKGNAKERFGECTFFFNKQNELSNNTI